MSMIELSADANRYLKSIRTPRMSIIIPAHNEEAVIGRCLRKILEGASSGELEIIVACNGCTDRTAEIASEFGESVRVVESTLASKIAALNLGDQTATVFPRFYLDADVVVSIDSLRKTAEVLRSGACLAASPAIYWDLSRCNWFVRAFYAVWQQQPYFDNGRLGAGLYAVSAAGHARIGAFPQITADDEYVRRKFASHERMTVPEATFTVTPPQTLRNLIHIKTRSRRGTLELEKAFPELRMPPGRSRGQLLWRIVQRPWLWMAVPVYALVAWTTWFRSKKVLKQGQRVAWERDMSSRVVEAQKLGRLHT